MPGQQQPPMMSGYVNPNQMKQQINMQNVRSAGVASRPGVTYANQPMQQQQQPQPPQQQQAPGQGQMPMTYMPEQTSMLMTPSGMPAGPPNGNRPGVQPSGKRKLVDAAMYSNEQPQYATPSKMALPSSGEFFEQRWTIATSDRWSLSFSGQMGQYQQNPGMLPTSNYMQQSQQQQVQQQQQQAQQQAQQQQQTAHSQMYAQGQMPSATYMNNQMLVNPAR
jgi:hypothetical protein